MAVGMTWKRAGRWSAWIAGGFAVLLAAGWLLPRHVRVTRTIQIDAPASDIYPLIADFKTGWERWNTFDDEEPGIRYAYSGPESGAGAAQVWTSKKMGDGRMTLVAADPAKGVRFQLTIGPQALALDGRLDMAPEGRGTKLTWTDECDVNANPVARWMGLILARMIGRSFETSLGAIKRLAEAAKTDADWAFDRRIRDAVHWWTYADWEQVYLFEHPAVRARQSLEAYVREKAEENRHFPILVSNDKPFGIVVNHAEVNGDRASVHCVMSVRPSANAKYERKEHPDLVETWAERPLTVVWERVDGEWYLAPAGLPGWEALKRLLPEASPVKK